MDSSALILLEVPLSGPLAHPGSKRRLTGIQMVLYTYINNNWFIKVSEMPGAAGYHIPEHRMEQKEKEIGEDREKE